MQVLKEKITIQFILNEEHKEVAVPPDLSLLRFLRDELQLTGTKCGCEQGHCGSCMVIVSGKAKRSCLLKMRALQGKRVQTIEGMGNLEKLHPLQEAFASLGAIQCGFCTPGMIMTGKALLDSNPNPSLVEIKQAFSGNLCRCGSYQRIIKAVESAANVLPENTKMADIQPLLNKSSNVIGKNVARIEVRAKATGLMRYADDIYREDMLHGKILWSAHPHAEILSINIEEAKKMRGVHAVLTGEDVPGINDIGGNQPMLANKKVRFIGDAVAVVFAETPELAMAATEKIKVMYKELEGVFSTAQALLPEAPQIHAEGNVEIHIPFHKGDVALGFLQADLIVEEYYNTPFIEHAYLETEAGVAIPTDDGGIEIRICTQQPRTNRDIVANCLNVPKEKVRIADTPCGGSFGGKFTITLHALLALGALQTKRPVKIVLNRQESMRMHPKRNAVYLEYKTGVKKDGRLTALQVKIVSDQGAYSPIGKICLEQMMVFASGPYFIPHVKIDGFNIYTNKVPGGAMRGFGDNMVAFAMESQMDIIAKKMGIDPFELRLINALDIGKSTGGGQILKSSVGIKECLTGARQRLKTELSAFTNDQKLGVGIAAAFKNVGGGGSSGAVAELTKDGKILIGIECPDIGQGSNTVMAQIASQTMGVKFEDIRVISGDTHEAAETGFTGAQRVTFNAGNAVLKACQSLKERILSLVSQEFDISHDRLSLEGDCIVEKNLHKPVISLSALGSLLSSKSDDRLLRAEEHHEMSAIHPLSPCGNTDFAIDPDQYANYPTYSYMVHVALIKVNEKTGKVNVLKVIAVHDVGRALNPQNCKSQIEGAIMMGLGYALSEEFKIENGWNITDTLRKCHIPTIQEMPEVEIVLIENPEPLGPFQAKGISEAATVAATPAIVNAIYDAVGVRITSLPANAKKVLLGLKQKIGCRADIIPEETTKLLPVSR